MAEVAGVFAAEENMVEASNQEALPKGETPQKMKDVSPVYTQPISFPIRGNSLNPLVDASQSLIALMIRIPDVSSFSQIDHLHKDVKTEIESLELELHRQGYDRATILAHRYCLCSAIDEAVMCSKWGQESDWSERSLLALFHSETWGGEKFFIVLSRLMRDPERYIDLLEFLYLVLCLGFEGKYRVMHNGRTQLEDILQEVHAVIQRERGDSPEEIMGFADKIIDKAHYIRRQTPVSWVWIIFSVLCVLTYLGFLISINNYTGDVIEQLQAIL
ncbi:type IVB secretion system protein IcmH/DotU [Flexibacterium corallicola]|uniref:type IVB secretion system protein IcmH/DotU n=1 Tax=Flexibacterium corallicola TaxID=3037259 RepID=UPI00286F69D4|nr:type IVB secretion system protein IcmH/DotU [Pseudovibrio sp. M1P-2-3]